MGRWLKTTLIFLGAVVIILAGVVALSLPSRSIQTSEDGKHSIRLAMLSIPIAATDPLAEDPDQYLGVPHPQPDFDIAEAGPDLSLVQDASELAALDADEVFRAVYLGHDVHGDPYYIWQNGSPNLRQAIGQVFADLGSVGRLETGYGSEVVGPAPWERDHRAYIEEHGVVTGSIATVTTPTESDRTLTAEWHGLPSEVAAVVLYEQSEAVGWQRPVSGTAAFQVHLDASQEHLVPDYEMVALTAAGAEWQRYQLYSG